MVARWFIRLLIHRRAKGASCWRMRTVAAGESSPYERLRKTSLLRRSGHQTAGTSRRLSSVPILAERISVWWRLMSGPAWEKAVWDPVGVSSVTLHGFRMAADF